MTITTAKLVHNSQVALEVFAKFKHGENCNRNRQLFGMTKSCSCYNTNCACRSPGETGIYLKGFANATWISLKRVKYGDITDRCVMYTARC